MDRVLEYLLKTRYEDISVYVELMKSLCTRVTRICTWSGEPEGETRGDVLARVLLESPDERDGYNITTDHCTGIRRYEPPREHCLMISLVHVRSRPPTGILGYSPIMVVPLWLIEDVIINVGDHSLLVKRPAYADFTYTIFGRRLEVLLEKFTYIDEYYPDYEHEPESVDEYVVRINSLT